MTKTVRKIALLLALLMVVSLFAACKSDKPEDTLSTQPTGSNEQSGITYDPEIPDKNWGDYTFTFAGRGDEANLLDVDAIDIVATGEEGDVVSQAIYKRNTYMKEKYNCNIDIVYVGSCTGNRHQNSKMKESIQKAIDDDSDAYAAIISTSQESIGFAMEGWTVDLNTVEYLDLQQEWWDQNIVRDLDVGKKVFFATGDIMTGDKKGVLSVVFNKKLSSELGYADHYKLVEDGKWTLETFYENARKTASDMDGDGQISSIDDRYGYIYWQDAMLSFVSGTGNAIGRTEYGLFELTAGSQSMQRVWQDMITFLKTDAAYSVWTNKGEYGNADKTAYNNALKNTFENKLALYAYASVSYISQMRQLDADFGVLPNPKLDENQQDYISATTPWAVNLITIPVTNRDLSRTGHILEAMAAKGKEMITPAFYEINLKSKGVTDYQSSAMLDLLFETRTYDLGNCFSWGNISSKMTQLFNAVDGNLASTISASRSEAENEMEEHMVKLGMKEANS